MLVVNKDKNKSDYTKVKQKHVSLKNEFIIITKNPQFLGVKRDTITDIKHFLQSKKHLFPNNLLLGFNVFFFLAKIFIFKYFFVLPLFKFLCSKFQNFETIYLKKHAASKIQNT